MTPKLSLRELNRATLDRQWLLSRRTATALEAVEHLVGMQGQSPLAPYVGLWSRLDGFTPDQLATLLEGRKVVRGSMMRATIHLMSSRDFLAMRPLIQPCMEREIYLNQTYGRHRVEGLDMDAVLATGRSLMAEAPRTAVELRSLLGPLFPDHEPPVLAHAVRCLLPTVQIPPRGVWGKGGNPTMSTAETWLGRSVTSRPSLNRMVLRYLAAFGPASVLDVQTWSGLTKLGEVVDRLRPKLRTYVDGSSGRELFDLAEVELPSPDTPAPVRFLPEFDNLLLSHADRSRVIDAGQHQWLIANERLVRGGVLYDGFVCALWKIARQGKKTATLEIQPLHKLTKAAQRDLLVEGNELLDFAAAGSTDRQVRWLTSTELD